TLLTLNKRCQNETRLVVQSIVTLCPCGSRVGLMTTTPPPLLGGMRVPFMGVAGTSPTGETIRPSPLETTPSTFFTTSRSSSATPRSTTARRTLLTCEDSPGLRQGDVPLGREPHDQEPLPDGDGRAVLGAATPRRRRQLDGPYVRLREQSLHVPNQRQVRHSS